MLMTINLYWPLFNLLPVWPLDGGRLTREICQAVNWNQGTRISLIISMAAAGFLAVNTALAINGKQHVPYLNGGGMYSVIFFAVLALQSFQLLQQENQRNIFSDRSPWE